MSFNKSNRIHNAAVIFDGDDTLWEIQPLYDAAMTQFAQLVGTQLPARADIRERLHQIDSSRVQTWGFGKNRFVGSMIETYRQLCAETKQQSKDKILIEIERIAGGVTTTKPVPMEGVNGVLARLVDRFDLYLYTGGERAEQEAKARNLGLIDYFVAVESPQEKTAKRLDEFLMRHRLDPKRTWMVGNSPRSDINPAIGVGLRCILIRSGGWAYDQEAILNGEVHEVDSLQEVMSILLDSETPH